MKTKQLKLEQGSTLVVTISVVATLLVLLGVAVQHTQTISRQSQRSRKTAQAMEIADGHLELLFSNWRNIYRKTWTAVPNGSGGTDYSILGTNYFFTTMYNPGPAPTPVPSMAPVATPSPIPTPPKELFPTEPNYELTQYRIQAVDPMINLDADGNALRETNFGTESFVPLSPAATPPAAYGPNDRQKSYFYLAAVDVTVPTTTGPVTAKVRRVFEKKFDNPWTYAMFYVDDLEFQPTTALPMNGPIHTNGSLYIGTNNFSTTSYLEFAGEYVNGFHPLDPDHSNPTAPNLVADVPPSQVSPYLPFGWNLNLDGTTNNNKSYRELIERPSGGTDPLSEVRLYNQAGYRILINENNVVTMTAKDGSTPSNSTWDEIMTAITTNQGIQDFREGTFVRLVTVNVAELVDKLNKLPAWNNIIYISDTSARTVDNGGNVTNPGVSVNVTINSQTVSTTKRGIRIKNSATLPAGGLMVVSDNHIYIQGDFNTGVSPPSNSGTYTDPDGGSYARRNAAIVGDAVTILSNAWLDSNSTGNLNSRIATNTTVNAAIVAGTTFSNGSRYSGGGENFVRFLEDWNKTPAHFTYYGSMVQLYRSQQATGIWISPGGNSYKSPMRHWYYDPNFKETSPPGNLQVAAYLQQQRWYQVY
jgi:hypothetical protein